MRWILALAVALCAVGCGEASTTKKTRSGATPTTSAPAPPVRHADPPTQSLHEAPRPGRTGATIDHVADGDTIALTSGTSVRLLQIDTPEVYGGAECFGAQASSALKRMLPAGTEVQLEADPRLDRTDHYGRQLRYVYRGGRNINLLMVRRGYASVWLYRGERGRYASLLVRAVRTARAHGRGLWGRCPHARLNLTASVDTGSVGAPRTPRFPARTSVAAPAGTAHGLPRAPAYPPDVDCGDLPGPVWVGTADPHRLDGNGDGIGCE